MGHRTNTVNRPLSLLCYSSALTVEKRINQDSALAPEGGKAGGEEGGGGGGGCSNLPHSSRCRSRLARKECPDANLNKYSCFLFILAYRVVLLLYW